MKMVIPLLAIILLLAASQDAWGQTYAGNQQCQTCHSSTSIGGTQFPAWQVTLHSKNNQLPNDSTIRPSAAFISGQSVSMGSGFNNAQVILSKVGNDFFAQIGVGGATYRIEFALGYAWKQRYLVRIADSRYVLPIQWNLLKYMDNSSGNWATYEPATWFNTDGTPKPINNAFRAKSWDRDCMGCHAAVGFRVNQVIAGSDTSWVGQWANSSSALNMTVGCEYCHGPSNPHSATINPRNLANKDRKIEVCAQCHVRSSSWRGPGLVGTHGYPRDEINNRYFKPRDTLSQFLNLATAPNASGGPGTWPDLLTARSHRQQYQEYIGSGHYSNPFVEVTCFTCHTMHRPAPNKHLVVDSLTVGSIRFAVKNEDNTLCLACHATHGPFASIPTQWVQNPVTYHDSIGAVVNLHTKHNLYDPLNTQNSGGIGRCATCHMSYTATTGRAYDIRTHSFNVVSPARTLQFQGVSTPTQGMLNSCAYPCHRNPSGSTANVPSFGIGTDATLTNWREPTDLALADTLWRYWQLWGFTGVKEIAGTLPTEFSLSQNYPNPFNPATRIVVDIVQRGTVRLAVYNIIGEQVATLMDGTYERGRYEVTWSGRDDQGFQVASGVYLYRLEDGQRSMTRKMVLLK